MHRCPSSVTGRQTGQPSWNGSPARTRLTKIESEYTTSSDQVKRCDGGSNLELSHNEVEFLADICENGDQRLASGCLRSSARKVRTMTMFDQPPPAKIIDSLVVIFDLDETLIHATEQPLAREPDFMVGPFPVYKRPFVEELLIDCARDCTLAVWTSATRDYAEVVLDRLIPAGVSLAFVWTRERCTRRYIPDEQDYGWIKDLKKVKKHGFALERVLMVDDIPGNLARQYGNYIRVTPYLGDEDDRELVRLARYLRELRGVENVRTVEKRGWQRRISLNEPT